MHPILFTLGPITIYSYGAMLALAVLASMWLLQVQAARQQLPPEVVIDLVFYCVLWGILGARIFYVLLNLPYFLDHFIEIPMLQKGGLAWQGGFVGGSLAGLWFARLKQLPLRPLLDLSAPILALGQSIGRVGCFLNGCCYGKPVSWGVYFPVHQDRLHPTQLYETAGLFLIFIILTLAARRPHHAGFIFVMYLWLAAIERFLVEFLRADHDVLWGPFSLFQIIAIGIFMAGLVLAGRFRK